MSRAMRVAAAVVGLEVVVAAGRVLGWVQVSGYALMVAEKERRQRRRRLLVLWLLMGLGVVGAGLVRVVSF